MERTTWGQINELFEAARRLPVEEREAWVRAATADEHVQAEVLSLLHAHEDDPWFVDDPEGRKTPVRVTPPGSWPGRPTPRPTPPSPSRLNRAAEPKAGGQFANYRLIREMAREASRVVFEGIGAAGAHSRVALHVLTADARDPVFTTILHAQGDILAHLEHPSFPRLVDGGIDADGTAYLAFEFVAGEPIDSWCRRHKLTVRERVDLVLAVCDAVQHAHEHLTIHGNLRTANILVSAGGAVRLLDCGMSTILDVGAQPDGAGLPLHQYASPEQARREVLTAASDVYALGILLYTLLTGYPPYELSGQTPVRARQLICEAEPDVPSTIVVGRDRRRLAGGLDRIALKALRKDPRERQPTAAALAADLRAWRDGRRTAAAPATVAIVGLVVAAGFLGWQAYLARAERDRAREALSAAELRQQEAEKARKANQPGLADLRLDVAARTSDLALAARRGGDPATAEALWSQALADLRPLLGAGSGDARAPGRVAEVRASLGSLCRSQRRFEESLIHYREALRARERAAAAPDAPPGALLALAEARTSVARLLLDLTEVRPPGRYDAARLREAAALLAQADPVVRAAAAASPTGRDALAEIERQFERYRRLTIRRQ